jgi:hypothetical protein
MPSAGISRLAMTSIGLVIAAIVGVQLGRSAISEINPIHFQGPLERPRAITPPPEPTPYDPYAQPYVWSMPPPASPGDCMRDCDTAQAREAMRLAMDASAGRDPALPYWRDATPATELRPWPPGALPERGRGVERYLHYPVDREQADRTGAEPAPAAAATAAAEALRPPPAPPEPAVED